MNKSKWSAFAASVVVSFIIGIVFLSPKGVPDQFFQKMELKKLDGSVTSLENLEGKVFLINFWASWCEPCKAEMPDFIELEKMYLDKGFKVILINLDETPSLGVQFLEEINQWNNSDLETYFDTNKSIASALNLQSIPSSYLVDSKGHEIFVSHGFVEWMNPSILEKIQENLQ